MENVPFETQWSIAYRNTLSTLTNHINSAQSYNSCIKNMFIDDIYNRGRICVWFYVTKLVYDKIKAGDRMQYQECVKNWFYVFKQKMGLDIQPTLAHLETQWNIYASQNTSKEH